MTHDHFIIKHAKENFSLSPEIVYTGVVKNSPDWFSISHQHEFCEILYVAGGKGEASVDGNRYSLMPGNMMILNPGVWHDERSFADDPLYLIFLGIKNFQVSGLESSCLLPPKTNAVIYCGEFKEKMDLYFGDLLSESSNQAEYYQIFTRSLVRAIVVLIMRLLSIGVEDTNQLTKECEKIKEYLDMNFTQPLTLEELSEHLNVSKHYLSHIFKEQTGFSPIKYITNKRMNYACDLLLRTDLPISEISAKAGYDNPLYFSQMFKKKKGVSPSEYRNNLTGKQPRI